MTLPDSTRITRRRPAWLIVAVGVAVVVLVVVGLVVFVNRGSAEPTPTPTRSAAPPPSPASSAPTGAEAGARGCLGGVDPNKAILQAHDEAELTPRGAAEFVGTLMRWSTQYPPDSSYEKIAQTVIHPDAGADALTINRDAVEKGKTAWGTTVGAKYVVSEFSNESATVRMLASGYVVADGDEQPVNWYGQWRLRAADGSWQVFDVDGIDQSVVDGIQTNGYMFEGVADGRTSRAL